MARTKLTVAKMMKLLSSAQRQQIEAEVIETGSTIETSERLMNAFLENELSWDHYKAGSAYANYYWHALLSEGRLHH